MAVINIIPIAGSRTANQDKDGKVSYSASFSLLTNNQSDSPNFVGFNQPFFVGEIYDGYPIQSVAIAETSDPCQWTITVNYGEGENPDENPLSEPWVYSVSYEQHEVPIDYDISGRPILNTAGDPFQEALFIDDARPTLTASKNFGYFPWNIANQYCNTVNRDSVFGAGPGTLKFERLTAR